MDWDLRFDLAFGASMSSAPERKTKASKLGISWDMPPQATPHLPSLASKAPRHLHSNGAALHGWTKEPAHHHLTAPPTMRDGGGVAPLYTVVLPGAKVRMGDHHATVLQDHLARQRATAWESGMSQTSGGKGLPQQSHTTTPVSPITSGTQHTAQGVKGTGSSTAKLPVHAASHSRLAASQPLAATQEDTWSNPSKIRRRGDVSQLQVHGVEFGSQPSQAHSPRHVSPTSHPPSVSQEQGLKGPTHKPQHDQQGRTPDPHAPLLPQSAHPALPSMNLLECMQGEASVLPGVDEDTQGLGSPRSRVGAASVGKLFLSGPLPGAQHTQRSGAAASQGGSRPSKPHTAHTTASVPGNTSHAKALLQQQLLLQQQQEQQQRQYQYQFHFMQHPQHPRHASRHMQATTLQAALHNYNSPAPHFELVRYPPFVQSYSPLARPFPALRTPVLKNRQESHSWAGYPMQGGTKLPFQHPNPHLVSSSEGVFMEGQHTNPHLVSSSEAVYIGGFKHLGHSAPVQPTQSDAFQSTQQKPPALPSSENMQTQPAGQTHESVANASTKQQHQQQGQQQQPQQLEGVQQQQQQQQHHHQLAGELQEGLAQQQQQQQQQQHHSDQQQDEQDHNQQQQQQQQQQVEWVRQQQQQQQHSDQQQDEQGHDQQQQQQQQVEGVQQRRQQQQQQYSDQQQDEQDHNQQQPRQQEPNLQQDQKELAQERKAPHTATANAELVNAKAKGTSDWQATASLNMSHALQKQQQQQQQPQQKKLQQQQQQQKQQLVLLQEQQKQQQQLQQQQELLQQMQMQQQQQMLLQQMHAQWIQQQQQQQQQAQQQSVLQAPLLAPFNGTKDKAFSQSFLLQGSTPHPASLTPSLHGNAHQAAGLQGANILGRGWLGQAPRHGAMKHMDSWPMDAVNNRLAASQPMPRESYLDWPLSRQGSPLPTPDLTQELSAVVKGVEGDMKKYPLDCSLPLAAKTCNIHKTGPLPRLNPQQHIPAPLLKPPPTPPSKAMTYLNLARPSLPGNSEGAGVGALSSRTPMYARRQGLSPTRELPDPTRAVGGGQLRGSLDRHPNNNSTPAEPGQGLQTWPSGQSDSQVPASPRLPTPPGPGVLHSRHDQIEDSAGRLKPGSKDPQGQRFRGADEDYDGDHSMEQQQLLQSRLPANVEVDVATARAEADARAAAAAAAAAAAVAAASAAAAQLPAHGAQLGWPGAGAGSNSRPPTRQGLAEAVEKVGAGLARRVGAESLSLSSQALLAQSVGAAAAGGTHATGTSVAAAPTVPDALPAAPSNATHAEAPDSVLASTATALEAQGPAPLPSAQGPTPSTSAEVQPQESRMSGIQGSPWAGADAGTELDPSSVLASKDADVWRAEETQAAAARSPHTHASPDYQDAGALGRPPSGASKTCGVESVPLSDVHAHLGTASFASRGSSYVDSMVEGLVASLPSRAVSAQGAPTAAAATVAAAYAQPATMSAVAAQGAASESAPGKEVGTAADQISRCGSHSISATTHQHSGANDLSAAAASEFSKRTAAAAAGGEGGAEAATQAAQLKAGAPGGSEANVVENRSRPAPHDLTPQGQQSTLTSSQAPILKGPALLPPHAAVQSTPDVPKGVQLPTQGTPNASLSQAAPPGDQDSSSKAEGPPHASQPALNGPVSPSPGTLPIAQASKSKSMVAGANLLKGDPRAAVSMDDPSNSPASLPLYVRPHPYSAPTVMLQLKEVSSLEGGNFPPSNGRPQHIEWDEDVCDVEFGGGAASRYSGSAPTSPEGSFTTGTTRHLLGSEDGEVMSVSAHGISAAQPLSQSFRSLSSSKGPSTPEPPSVNDTISEDGTRLLGGKYEVQHVVGEGAYGLVMKCKIHRTDPPVHVAVKEFKTSEEDPDAEDVKRTSRREVALLRHLQHPNVVRFVDEFLVRERLFIVMEYVPCNLLELLEAQPGGMDQEAVRLIVYQLCSAISFIHAKSVIYRDVKPENLLVDEQGRVKLCDLGFARFYHGHPDEHLTDYVATRWYRAPELLLGPPFFSGEQYIQSMYGPPVDMWAIGCLMGELMDGEPLFPGDSDLDQLYRIQTTLGPITHQQQVLFASNPHNTGVSFNIAEPEGLARRYKDCMSEVELDFISKLLNTDPAARMTGPQCLQHPYLRGLWEADQAKEKGEAARLEAPPSVIKADNKDNSAKVPDSAGKGSSSRGSSGRSANGSSSGRTSSKSSSDRL